MSLLALIKITFSLVLLCNVKEAWSEDIIGCGGFIKSDVEINFSLIEVALYSKQGSLKYRTDCSPTNGYYMLPVYSKGEYVLKVAGPKGWTFEPAVVDLMIDGKEDVCTLNKDINFVFTGFGVVGKVLSRGEDSGPKGVKLVLEKEKGGKVAEVESGKGGGFVFEKVLPGSYVMQASHPTWKFSVSSSKVRVVKEVGEVEKDITVAGYPLKGTVHSSKTPVMGVNFLLYKKRVDGGGGGGEESGDDVVEGCVVDGIQPPTLDGATYLCHVTSARNGNFLFQVVKSGSYVLLPMYQSDRIKYEIQPFSLDVTIAHDSLTIKEPFQVSGFMVSGVLKRSPESDEGIEDAEVLVDGQRVTTTDREGLYHLEGMRSASYVVSFRREGFLFHSSSVAISPNNPSLPLRYPLKYRVCGRVILANPADLGKPRKVIFSSEAGKKVADSQSDEHGSFCTHLPPGHFSAAVETTQQETQSGFKLMPPSHAIHVIDDVVNDVTFSQFHAIVTGVVKCLESCGKVRLMLTNLLNNIPHSIQEVSSDGDTVEFVFEKVMTGNYEVKLDSEERCWSNNSVALVVLDRDVAGVVFEQIGVVVNVAISVPATVHFKPIKTNKGKLGLPQPQKFALHSKVNRFCVDKPGRYEVVVESCHQFEQQQYFYDTSDRDMLVLNAVSYPVSLITVANDNHRIFATVTTESGTQTRLGPLKKGKASGDGGFVYMLQYWSKQRGERLSVSFESDILLFEPKSLTLHVDPETCPSGEARVVSREGVFVKGSIKPPLSDVDVTLTSQHGGVLRVKTDQAGVYKVGPVDRGLKWEVGVSKRGYNLVALPDNPTHFQAFKLAEIVVKVVDSLTGEHLAGVLISLSGSDAFRTSHVTGEAGSEDGLVFSSLDPGEYFLKPMMKEYVFQPPHHSIPLKQGVSVPLQVVATRVAYSCFGSVTSLSGEPEAGVYIEAVATAASTGHCSEHQEESKSEADGSFRIRGLKPSCTYEVGMKVDAPAAGRTSPKKISVQVGEEDVRGVVFVLFRTAPLSDVTGRVNVPAQHLPTLKMHIYSDSDLDSPLHVQSLSQSPFFHFSVPIHKTYILKLVTSLKPTHFLFSVPELKLFANQSFHHHVIDFQPEMRVLEVDMKHSSLFMLPITILLILAAYHHKSVLHWLSNQAGSFSTMISSSSLPSLSSSSPSSSSSSSSSFDASHKEEHRGDAGKKKFKAKKI